ncbi:MAG: hypothetical protein IANPNBLG_03401 [Bryobacteraceae bacterium]|nr:hypothetical protein [Bryobacteraceae bacterium]
MSSISQAHSDAARLNGAKSHGPITPEGKARSSSNARTHGLTASRIVFLTPMEQEEYATLLHDYTSRHQPQNPEELDVFNMLIHAAWRLRNLTVAEAQLYAQAGGDPLLSEDPLIEKRAALLHRYRAEAERSYHRHLNQLKSLQNNRLYQEQFSKLLPSGAPPLANAAAFTKRTQDILRRDLDDTIKQAAHEAKSFNSQLKDVFSLFANANKGA